MLSPQFQYVIYKDQERRLEREIELARTASERRGEVQPAQPWYAQAAGWLKVKVFTRAPKVAAAARSVEGPCHGMPC